MRFVALLAAALALVSPAAAETVLIRDGRVVTNTSAGVIENGDVLIVDGRISAVGPNIRTPAGARSRSAGPDLTSSLGKPS